MAIVMMVSLFTVAKWDAANTRGKKEYIEARGEIVVIFDNPVSDEFLGNIIASFNTRVELVQHIEDYALFFVEDSTKYKFIMEDLQSDPQVAAVQANVPIETLGFSNDPYADAQWAIKNPGHYSFLTGAGIKEKAATEDVDMDVAEAWELFDRKVHKQKDVTVAIVDTGIDYKHPDLADNMWVNRNEIPDDKIDNDNNGYVDDIYGWDFYNKDASTCHYKYYPEYDMNLSDPEDNDDHGTHVAGIIGAIANNNQGIAGIASNVNLKLMTLKINGGKDGKGNVSSAIEAVKYATKMGADICNMSWGTSNNSESLKTVMKESDLLFVSAAGNTGTNNDTNPVYPASFELNNMISVTFINSTGQLTKLSNFGSSSIDLAAPGEDIFSTVVGSYGTMTGSSMAAPQVAGVAAMLYAHSDYVYPSNVRDLIINSRKPLKNLEEFMKYPGIPNAFAAEMASDGLAEDTIPPELSFETIYYNAEMLIPIKVTDQGGSGLRVLKWIIGARKPEDFSRGMTGFEVKDNRISVSRAGIYTFYAADYAGNEIIQSYEVKEDKTAPKVSSYFTVADNYKSRTITTKVNDAQSGIRKAKYMVGTKTAADFLPADAGTEIKLKDGKGSFKVKKDGTYTIFVTDNRGNSTVKKIVVKTVKATDIKFSRSKVTLGEGENYTLKAFVKPVTTTDKITYTSSNKSIVTVTDTGIIKAIREGKAYITAKTSSGTNAVCQVIIIKKPNIE